MRHFGSAKCFTIGFISCARVLSIEATSAAPRASLQRGEPRQTLPSPSSLGQFRGQSLLFCAQTSVKVDWWWW